MDDSDGVPDDVLWWTFEDQTIVGHGLAVIVGAAVWVGVYVFLLDAGGNLEYAYVESAEAISVRHSAWQAASTACWLWFSIAFLLGKGGPFRNGFVYPATLSVVGPWVVSLVLFRSFPHGVHSTAFFRSQQYVRDGYMLVVPGMLLAMTIVGVFACVLHLTGRTEAWVDRHMPEEWHEIDVSETPFGHDEE